MGFEQVEEITRADVALRVWGADLGELFSSAGEGVMSVMVARYQALEDVERREVRLENAELDMLLFAYLREFLYFKDAEELLLLPRGIEVEAGEGIYRLTAVLGGERIRDQELLVDIKAITMHAFRVGKTEEGWEALVVVDV